MAVEDKRALAALSRIESDPALAHDVARWIDASEAAGGAPIVAYRSAPRPKESLDRGFSAPIRSVGSGGNRLFHAENLSVLRRLLDDGERFRCVYIDPPFGTRQQFVRKKTNDAAYCDAAYGGEYLAALRERLVLLRDLLEDDGSLFLHLDSAMVAEAKVLLDELFGPANFRSWLTRRKCSSKNFTRKTFGDVTDFILFYSKGKSYVWNRPLEPRTPEQEEIDFPKIDPDTGRRFALVPLHAPGSRNGATGERWRGMLPPAGKHWQWVPDKLDQFDAEGNIYWTRNGTPRRKIWADESAGTRMTNLLLDYRDPFNQNFSTTGYPTEKNLDLLKRLVEAATNPGDAVLDCYCGSGTTLHAAAETGRAWVGVDKGDLAIALTQRRLATEALQDETCSRTFGFRLWGPRPESDAMPEVESDEIEFAFRERPLPGGLFEVMEVIEPGRQPMPGSVAGSAKRRWRTVAFDHGGQPVSVAPHEASQSSVTRPA